jgi:PAS domain S-box-containing protein
MNQDGLRLLLINAVPEAEHLSGSAQELPTDLLAGIVRRPTSRHFSRTSSTAEALCLLAEEIFDAVFLDIRRLPDFQTEQIVSDISQSAPDTPLILFCSPSQTEHAANFISYGADEILTAGCCDEAELHRAVSLAEARKLRQTSADSQYQILEFLAKGYPLATLLPILIKDIERRIQGAQAAVALLDKSGTILRHAAAPNVPLEFQRATDGIEAAAGQLSWAAAARLGRQIITSDIGRDPAWERFRGVAEHFEIGACWAQPIFSSGGKVLGTVTLFFRAPRSPKAAELRVLQKAAAAAGIALSQRRSETALRYRFDFEKLIFSISARFVSTASEHIDEETILALESIAEFAGVDRSYVFLLAPDGNSLNNTHQWSRPGLRCERHDLQHIRLERFPWLRSKLERHDVVYIKNPADLPAPAATEQEELERHGIRSLVAVPMLRAGQLLGFVGLDNISRPLVWSSDVVVLLKMFARIFANAFERRRVEEEFRASREQFLQHEAQLRLTFNTAQIGMATCDLSGRLLSVNNTFCKMLGREAEELLRIRFSDISHPEDRIIPRRKLVDLLRGRVSHIELEQRYIHKNGSVISTVKRLGAIFDSEKRPRYLVAEIEDISEKKKWEAEYLKSCKLESLGVLAGGIAHDFNNILMAMLGSISFSKLDVPGDSPLFQRLGDVENAVYRARDLTRQLLTFAKGGTPIVRTTSIAALLRETIGFTLAGSDVSASFDAAPNLWPARVDEGQISQVINNLVLNACQAMPEGGNLVVRCDNVRIPRGKSNYGIPLKSGAYIRIRLRDEGSGISSDHLSKIFDPFFTTKEGGSGLGLSTTYSIVKRHHGHIEVESTPGVGTEFSIYLPASPNEIPEEKSRPDNLIHGAGRILLMDDETMVRNVAGHMLTRLGYEVDFAENGTEAVERYQRARDDGRPFDAVIMDLTIPGGMGGRVAIRKLKKLDPTVRAIVSSGYADGPVMAEYQKYGFCGMMAKPYEINTLSNVLQQVLAPKQ